MTDKPSKLTPDTVIKLFGNYSSSKEHENQLREMLQSLMGTSGLGVILGLAEDIQGDIYERTFPYIFIRKIEDTEKLLQDTKNDGDPMSDYFMTLVRIKSIRPISRVSPVEQAAVHKVDETMHQKRYIVLAFKVVDDDRTSILDQTWSDWTGTEELLGGLSLMYNVTGVSCFKGVNVVPDIFKYFVFIEIDDVKTDEKGRCYLMDCIQKFRIYRMTGYTALYTIYNSADINKMLDQLEP